ncbi:MAG TPA: TlpA disulfide reductase family protein [Flavipsychrobacter sp.]
MKMLLFLLTMITWSALYAQDKHPAKEQRPPLPNFDPVNNERFGKDYVPFSITTLDGKQIDNNSIRGKVAFFTFWFKRCAACLAEFGELNELYSHFRNDTNVVFVAITFDKKEEITDVLEKYEVAFPVATITSQKEASRMNYGRGFPSIVLLDKQGKIRWSGTSSVTTNDNEDSLNTLTVNSAVKLINRYKSE